MRKKIILVLISFLFLLCPFKTFAAENGWIARGNEKYYYINGEMQKGVTQIGEDKYFFGEYSGRLITGLVTSELSGKTYYSEKDGKLVTGFKTISGTTYYFSTEDNSMQKGITQIGEDRYFFGEYSGRLITGWVTSELNKKTYYSEKDGKLVTGFKIINGTTYYFSTEDNSMQKGITQIGEDRYFFGENSGRLITGLVTSELNKKTYYSEKDGKLVTGFKTINGTTYYFSTEDNSMQKGVTQIGEVRYFFGEYSGRLITGLVTSELSGKTYYSEKDGKLVTGFKTISGTTYYFSTEDNSMQKGIIQIGEDKYFFGEYSGRLITGWVTSELNKKTYYSEKDGKLVTGFKTINGTTYYFSPEDNSMQKGITQIGEDWYFFGEYSGRLITGWVTSELNKKTYYSEKDGKLVTGFHVIDNITYLFGDEYYLFTGFYDADGERYYYKEGIKQTGVTQIGGDSYFFGEYSGRLITGWVTAELTGQTYYSRSDGKLLKGYNIVDGNAYFFGEHSARLITGWVTAEYTGKTYYSGNDGILVKGDQIIDGSAYSFYDDNSLKTGWQTINGKKYYFYANGTRARYICKIAGVRYEFSANGELQHSNIKIIADLSFHNGYIDWNKLWASGEIDGVILRIGYSLGQDSQYLNYLSEARRLGIPHSVYHFSIAENIDEATKEANSLVKWYKDSALVPAMGVFYDIESWKNYEDGHTSDGISASTYDSIIKTYKRILNNNGISMSLYTGKNYAETRLSSYARSQIGWIAQYASDCTYQGSYRGWQYTSKGKLPGVTGNVDLSIFYY